MFHDPDLYFLLFSIVHTSVVHVYIIQVAALAPLALLLVLEARCAHFVIAHFNNMSNASLLPHIYILYMMTNLHRRLLQRCEWTLP